MMDLLAITERFQKVKTLRIVQLGMSIAAVVLAAIGATRIVGFALAAVTVCGYLFFSRGYTRGYCEEIIRLNLSHGLCGNAKDAVATGSGSLSEETFDTWQLLPRREGKGEAILSRNGFACTVGDTRLHGSEITVHYELGAEGSRKSYHFLSGTALWREGGQGDWLLLHNNWIHPIVQNAFIQECGYHQITIGEALAKDFLLFSHDPEATLPETLEKELKKLAAETTTLGALRLSEGYSAVFLLNRFYAPKVSAYAPATEREITTNTLPERDQIFPILCR